MNLVDFISKGKYDVYIDDKLISSHVKAEKAEAKLISLVLEQKIKGNNVSGFIIPPTKINIKVNDMLLSDFMKSGKTSKNRTGSQNGVINSFSNFKIPSNATNTITFDSSSDLTGVTISDFTLQDVDGITVTAFTHSGNVGTLTLSSVAKWWHNFSIKYKDYTDMANFDIFYVKNEIKPTETGTRYYVNNTVGASGDGLSEANAFKTITEGLNAVNNSVGSVFVKATGTSYPTVTLPWTFHPSNLDNPIFVCGYSNIADIPAIINGTFPNYYQYGENVTTDGGGVVEVIPPSFNNTKFPRIDAGGADGAIGINLNENTNGIIIKNFDIENYHNGIYFRENNSKIQFENINISESTMETDGVCIRVSYFQNTSGNHSRFTNCNFIDPTEASVQLVSNNTLLLGCNSYSNRRGTDETDYHMHVYGGKYNQIVNSKAWLMKSVANHVTHSFGFKSRVNNPANEYNLIDGCEAINTGWNYEMRNDRARYNVIKNSSQRRNVAYKRTNEYSSLFTIYSGSSFNKIYNVTGEIQHLFQMSENAENGSGTLIGDSNYFDKITATITTALVRVNNLDRANVDNSFVRNFVMKNFDVTGNNVDSSLTNFFRNKTSASITFTNNKFIDCKFTNIPTKHLQETPVEDFAFVGCEFISSFTP